MRRHETNCSRLIYCSLRIVAPLSQRDETGQGASDARPDPDALAGHDIRAGSKIGIDGHGEQPFVFYVDESNGVDSLRRSEIPAGRGSKRVTPPSTVVTNVELCDPGLGREGSEADADGGNEDAGPEA